MLLLILILLLTDRTDYTDFFAHATCFSTTEMTDFTDFVSIACSLRYWLVAATSFLTTQSALMYFATGTLRANSEVSMQCSQNP